MGVAAATGSFGNQVNVAVVPEHGFRIKTPRRFGFAFALFTFRFYGIAGIVGKGNGLRAARIAGPNFINFQFGAVAAVISNVADEKIAAFVARQVFPIYQRSAGNDMRFQKFSVLTDLIKRSGTASMIGMGIESIWFVAKFQPGAFRNFGRHLA